MEQKTKLIVVVGPTASGKTGLSLLLAERFNGEIISADSRQVYRSLDIGTEKISKLEMRGIPHHLIDIVDPRTVYTAYDFAQDARVAIQSIATRAHLPIIAGGTLLYIETLLGYTTPAPVPPNQKLRTTLETHQTSELYELLRTKDPLRASVIDSKNRRRLIRALEIIDTLGTVPHTKNTETLYDPYIIGLTLPREELRARIETRLAETLQKGLVEETQTLLTSLPRERLSEIGLEYRVVMDYLSGILPEEKLTETLIAKVWQYAKRQETWLSRMQGVVWYHPTETARITTDVETFLTR